MYRVSQKKGDLEKNSQNSSEREKVGVFQKIQLVCCRIGTKPVKISGEMAKKNKLEVGNHPLKIFLRHFYTNLERFGAYPAAFKLNFLKHTNFFHF